MAGPAPEPAPPKEGKEKAIGIIVGLIFALLALGAIGGSAAVASTTEVYKDDKSGEKHDDGDHSDDEDHSGG